MVEDGASMRRLAVALTLVLAAPVSALSCGVERVAVKNLADAQAADAFNSPVKQMTVSDLAAMPLRPKGVLLKHDSQRFPEELFRIRVDALMVGYKLETDGDYHIVIADPDNLRVTMIAEIPSPVCVTLDLFKETLLLRAQFDADFGKPTSKFKRLPQRVPVTVEGILFRDFLHGQTGVAPSGTEIHPVLALDRRAVALPAHSARAD
jgi:hypothetical protein